MSANPQMMAQMLASQLGGQPQSVGGMQGQNSGALGATGAAAQMAQKIMLMRALQQGQPPPGQPPQPGMPPQPNIMGQVAAQPQAMQQMQMPGGVNA